MLKPQGQSKPGNTVPRDQVGAGCLVQSPPLQNARENQQKSMNASEKKGDESKVRRKRKSREEAKEDKNLAKRIIAYYST